MSSTFSLINTDYLIGCTFGCKYCPIIFACTFKVQKKRYQIMTYMTIWYHSFMLMNTCMHITCLVTPSSQGLLELEGNVASILVHLVKRDQHATAMLDHSATDAGTVKDTVKERLDELLMTTGDITEDLVKEVCVIAHSLGAGAVES